MLRVRSWRGWILGGCALLAVSGWRAALLAAPNDWAEGSAQHSDGASRDYYNRGALLRWNHLLGDWHDAEGKPQGPRPYAAATIVDDDREKPVDWDLTPLVGQWLTGKYPNQGLLLRAVRGRGTFVFASREAAREEQRPQLILRGSLRTVHLAPQADTHLDRSTYRSLGHEPQLRVAADNHHTLLRFDLPAAEELGHLQSAVLRLHCTAQYGETSQIGAFRSSQGHGPAAEPVPGLAARYPGDAGIQRDADVLFFCDFDRPDWQQGWTQVENRDVVDTVDADPPRHFQPLQGKALRVRIAQGATGALNMLYKFAPAGHSEPEEIYFRYYLRLGNDWNQTVQGGKLPGISGTYGVAGWGGRRSDGANGWSARGAFHLTLPDGNPLAGLTPIGTYCYHADQAGTYGDIWIWQDGYLGYLQRNRWYAIEQYLKLNDPGQPNGVLRAWIDGRPAFAKTDIRFRTVDRLRIEQVWMNIYHGGTRPSPYDQHAYIDHVVIARKCIGPLVPLASR